MAETVDSAQAENDGREPVIQISHVWKFFGALPALQDVSLTVMPGERVVIIGPSGSGKSTLLRSINRLEKVDRGSVIVEDQDITTCRDRELNKLRQRLGMVFQQFNLFPHKTVLKNLTMAPIKLLGLKREEAEHRALDLLKKVGISDKANVYPSMLSGGQQQRVAIGRALITKPKLILADEPTGNLDSKNSQDVIALLTQASRRYQQTILMITHNKDLTASVDRVFRVSDGVLTDLGGKTNEALS